MQVIRLSRRNLQTLLNKLDRNKVTPGASQCTILKRREGTFFVQAVEDEEYYQGEQPGPMHPIDDPDVTHHN